MAVNMGQAAIAGTAFAFIIPPGACSVTVYSGAATTLYLGTQQGRASPRPTGTRCPLTRRTSARSTPAAGRTVYGLNTAATTLAVNYIVSTEA